MTTALDLDTISNDGIKVICSDGGWILFTEVEQQRCHIWRDVDGIHEMLVPFATTVVLALREYLALPKIAPHITDVHRKNYCDQFARHPAARWVHHKWHEERDLVFDLLNLSNFLDVPCLLHLITFQVAHALTHTDKREWRSLLR